ncbi:hypothetical protein [Pontivivens ytuae]|uniref:Uncharacterized protein n=1 Tax=Pontivivens ytuae TaxID=2789856 RepID=A0A7S9LUN7_9RHOB|nr:hypothetical protein [Pontivivens ytuae]QPH55587.1 hypothetical protein I0K15_07595 [Pontivivens ytuae]
MTGSESAMLPNTGGMTPQALKKFTKQLEDAENPVAFLRIAYHAFTSIGTERLDFGVGAVVCNRGNEPAVPMRKVVLQGVQYWVCDHSTMHIDLV